MEWLIWSLYGMLFALGALFPEKNSLISLIIVCFNLVILFVDRNKQDIVLFSSFVLGSEAIAIINMAVYCVFSEKGIVRFNKIKSYQFFAILVLTGNSIICSFIYNTFWNCVFYIIYLLILAITAISVYQKIEKRRLLEITKKFVIIELLATLCIILRIPSIIPGDAFYGTMGNAHFFGNWLIILIFVLIYTNSNSSQVNLYKQTKENIFYFIMLLLMLYLSDSKTLILVMALSAVIYFILSRFVSDSKRILVFLLTLCTGMFCFIGIIYIPEVRNHLKGLNKYIDLYVYTDGWNPKFEYFRGTLFDSLKGLRLWAGYGFGKYGSRVDNAFAYSEMWRADNFINNFISSIFNPHFVPQFAQYVSMYTEEFVSGIRWRSAILSYPFSSLIALIGETGIIGVILFSNFINKLARNSVSKIIIFYFAVACIFDIYFDNYQCIGIVILYILNTYKEDGYISQKY